MLILFAFIVFKIIRYLHVLPWSPYILQICATVFSKYQNSRFICICSKYKRPQRNCQTHTTRAYDKKPALCYSKFLSHSSASLNALSVSNRAEYSSIQFYQPTVMILIVWTRVWWPTTDRVVTDIFLWLLLLYYITFLYMNWLPRRKLLYL